MTNKQSGAVQTVELGKTEKVKCPHCCWRGALLEPSGIIYCVNCESGVADLEGGDLPSWACDLFPK